MEPEVEVEEIKEEALISSRESGERILSDKIMADCFVALTLSMLEQYFMSSDLKYFIIHDMYSNLKERGYTEEQLDKVKIAMHNIVAKYNTRNNFMG